MLKTCFSSRKQYHIEEEYEEYDLNDIRTESTIGFEQLKWGNDFSYLIPNLNQQKEDVVEEEEDEEGLKSKSPSPIEDEEKQIAKKKTRLNKLERKELRKLKRQQRHLPRNLHLSIHPHDDDTRLTLKELIRLSDQVPDSFELHNTTLYKEDLLTLQHQEWLNDNIISYVYNIFETYQLKPFYQKFNLNENTILLLPPSLCYLVLSSKDPDTLISMFPENFNKCKFLILPLNDGGSHWSLSVISILDRIFYSFDSLTNLNIEENDLICANFNKIIAKLLQTDKFKLSKKNLKTPQQLNDYDCGIFVICLSCFIISELIGSQLINSKSWKLDFNLNSKINNVDCFAIRHFILKSIIDGTIKDSD